METLIWKYIDNYCTESEVQEVKNLLATNAAFKAKYDDCLQLNELLNDHSNVPFSPAFKIKMVSQIESQVNQSQQASTAILPIQLVLVLSFMAIASILVAILFTDNAGSSVQIELPMDERAISLAIWSMGSFVCLVFTDFFLKKHIS